MPRSILLAVLMLVSACGADPQQADVCWAIVGAVEEHAREARPVNRHASTDPAYDVVVDYEVPAATGGVARRSISCGFEGDAFDEGRLELRAVHIERGHTGSDSMGSDRQLSEMEVFWLGRWLAMRDTLPQRLKGESAPEIPAGRASHGAFALQLAVNASVLGCVYGLLALGFTLIHGIIARINLAFGQIYMIGAVATALAGLLFGALGLGPLAGGLVAAMLLATGTAAAHSYLSERLVFRPLRDSAVHVPLIATIGFAIFLQEYVRLLQGAGNLWVRALPGPSLTILERPGFTVLVSPIQIAIIASTLAIYTVLALLVHRTAFGRNYRACASDLGMAALVGINVERVVATTFIISGLLAGAAGFFVVEYYGIANFVMGFTMGFKALVAAIVGGIGSIPGAMLGGLLLALVETAWAGWLDPAWRDTVVFGLLALTLIWRPQGLLAVEHSRRD